MKLVDIYCDGACSKGRGGYGAYLMYGKDTCKLSGPVEQATNQQAEMVAAIRALDKLTEPCKVRIYSDSRYLVDGMSVWIFNWRRNGWKRRQNDEPIKNQNLWEELWELSCIHDIEWIWIKGHNGHKYNELVDSLAKQGVKKCLSP